MLTRKTHLFRLAIVGLFVAAVCAVPHADAGGTDPLLVLGQVTANAAGDGSTVRVRGSWEFDNLLQVDFPLTVVASQGDFFVRVPVGGAAASSGTFSGLSDGFDASEIAVLESLGSAENGATILALDSHEIVVYLPASITNGEVTVVVYVELPNEGGFVSNTLVASLVGVGS